MNPFLDSHFQVYHLDSLQNLKFYPCNSSRPMAPSTMSLGTSLTWALPVAQKKVQLSLPVLETTCEDLICRPTRTGLPLGFVEVGLPLSPKPCHCSSALWLGRSSRFQSNIMC